MESWKEMLQEEFKKNGDDFSKMISTLSEYELNRKFDSRDGSTVRGVAFVTWGERFVYFPVCYDSAIWVGSVPRNPGYEFETRYFGG